ncbi:outer membrane protein transport protein, partial [Escherichia coli]|uniref:outer membrane protein transport protein n=1 Tax=Escherichia coli TaxID=562 RepID=UPI000A89E319
MSQKTLFTKSALAVAVALISTQAWSAGFQLNEFSSSGLGRAYSGEGAIADDAGNVSRNPALITMFDRPTFSAGAVYIDPDVNISGTSPSGRSLKADNIAPTAWVPNMHFVAPINDQFGWGASITSNYGLATEFNDTYAGGSVGGTTDLETMNLNLSGAYRLNNAWSFGLGFNAVYARAKIERFAGDLGQLVAGQMSDFGITVDTVGGSCQCLPLLSLSSRRLHNLTGNQLPQIACETFNFRASVDGVET